ncbi:hypothetical protein GCM10011587_02950 [Pyruvatibacter mobilis]|nr:hypothetical protein GCM10011587_02950 [Pyruvatibacter mobilis]
MIQTLAAAEVLFSRPLLIKNAWNCFRLDYLHQTFPNSKFIWLRRDIAAAAKSDLQARYITKKLPTAWNSATPRNYPHLKTRPYWEQVVENQYEFARAIQDHISMAGKQHITEVWYEDLLEDEEQTLSQLASAAPELGACLTESQLRRHEPTKSISTSLSPEDDKAIEQYIAATSTRLTNCRYPTK